MNIYDDIFRARHVCQIAVTVHCMFIIFPEASELLTIQKISDIVIVVKQRVSVVGKSSTPIFYREMITNVLQYPLRTKAVFF